MKIIDSHVHFWDPGRLQYEWLDEVPAIKKTHLPEDYRLATGDLEVAGLVFVEAACKPEQSLAEISWVETLAVTEPRILGMVAAASMETGEAVAGQLESLAGISLVKGVRRLIQGEAPGFCTQPKFMEAVRLLPDFDLRFDLCIKHSQFPEMLELVAACPGTSFILDHIGKPDIALGIQIPWRDHIRELAAMPNVSGCKLSGLITEANWESWKVDDLRPYLEHVIDCFGTDRVLYGSDWPVSVLAGGYQRWWRAFESVIASLPMDDQLKIISSNAVRMYDLKSRNGP